MFAKLKTFAQEKNLGRKVLIFGASAVGAFAVGYLLSKNEDPIIEGEILEEVDETIELENPSEDEK